MKKQNLRTLLAGTLLVSTLTAPGFSSTTSQQLQLPLDTPSAQILFRTQWNMTKAVWVNNWTNCI